MDTLRDLMNEEIAKLNHSKYKRIEDFINRDVDSATFMRDILGDPDFASGEGYDLKADIAQSRARHSAITYLMGLVFRPFYEFEMDLPADLQTSDTPQKLWLLVALYHDIGYLSERLKNPNFNYDSFRYKLFTDIYPSELANLISFRTDYPEALAYTYKEILTYDEYARRYHADKSKKDTERIDHGILGGAITFDQLIRNLGHEKTRQDLVISKYCSLTIAQHNIYKSSSEEEDKKYPLELHSKLSSESPFRIGKGTPLLLFLCLIDTIEAVKKFSKKENDSSFLTTLTVLKSIQVEVTKNKLILDYTELYKNAKRTSNMKGAFEDYLGAVTGLANWTTFQATQIDDPYVVEITNWELQKESIAAMTKRGDYNV